MDERVAPMLDGLEVPRHLGVADVGQIVPKGPAPAVAIDPVQPLPDVGRPTKLLVLGIVREGEKPLHQYLKGRPEQDHDDQALGNAPRHTIRGG
ncbi:hypothetical protein [Mesorhizobium sp. M0478]|uniref:hypothetical protein n=1 Tax=Mesorhizobium sp. M0478 TaxID=2956947 RepID=UPI00333D1F60